MSDMTPGPFNMQGPVDSVDAKQRPFNLFKMLGEQVPKFYNKDTRMGAWTGLPPMMGAPVSGALWGAGLGAAYGGISSLFRDEEYPEGPVPWYKKPWVVGALLGTGVGLYAGADKGPPIEKQDHHRLGKLSKQASERLTIKALAKKAADGRQDLARIVMSDVRLSPNQREVTLRALSVLPEYQLRHIVSSLGVGAITGLALYKLLGASGLTSSMGGLLASHLFNTYAAPKHYI